MLCNINPIKIQVAAKAILDGGVVSYPTEAVFGLGCNPFSLEAVVCLLNLKKRTAKKASVGWVEVFRNQTFRTLGFAKKMLNPTYKNF